MSLETPKHQYNFSPIFIILLITSHLKPAVSTNNIELCDPIFMENQTIGYGVQNHFNYYPWRSFDPENGEIEYVEVIGENVKCLCKTLFFPRSVREAVLVDLGVEYIEPGFFENTNVDQVDLRANHLQIIRPNVFSNTTIRSLILANNHIVLIAPNAFDDMPKLEAISLDNNRLTQWDTNWFKNAVSLYEVSMTFNHLSTLPGNLTKNWYNAVPFSYPTYDVLGSVNFDNNRVESIHPNAFRNVNLAYAISLSNNKLTDVAKGVFEHVRYLLELNLSGNKIVCLGNETLDSLRNVRKLFLTENPLNYDCKMEIKKFFDYSCHVAYF